LLQDCCDSPAVCSPVQFLLHFPLKNPQNFYLTRPVFGHLQNKQVTRKLYSAYMRSLHVTVLPTNRITSLRKHIITIAERIKRIKCSKGWLKKEATLLKQSILFLSLCPSPQEGTKQCCDLSICLPVSVAQKCCTLGLCLLWGHIISQPSGGDTLLHKLARRLTAGL